MAIQKIQSGRDNPILRTKSKKVLKMNSEVKKLIKDMYDTLHLDGIGLAAPQIGVNLRVVLVTLNPGKVNENTITMINPDIVFFSDNMEVMEEGCLSIPKFFADVRRPKSIIVKYQDQNMKERVLDLTGLNARIVQHELDHIDAILFVDRMEGKEKAHKEGKKNLELRL